jgi:Lysyl oxidase
MPPRHWLPLAALALLLAAPAPALAADLLPDLDQETPRDLQVATDASGAIPRFHLGFQSAVDNHGAGPLLISGHRESQDQPEMVADQLLEQSDGSMRTIAAVGRLRYVYSEDHNHWHYLGFDHYELRRAGNYQLVAPDQKTGFCLGDRYDTDTTSQLPAEPSEPVHTGYCGRNQTQLLSVDEGISVGYGDVYFANLEGQFVDVTGVPAGEYYLVHRVNADRKLLESDYSNDAASLLVDLSWPQGTSQAPTVKVLRQCPATDSCPGPRQQPPRLTRRVAERYARTVFERVRRFKPVGFKVACTTVRGPLSRACSLRGAHGGRRYSLREVLWYQRWKSGLLYLAYSAGGKRGRVLVGRAKASAAVAQPSQRLVAFDDPLLDGVRLGPVVHEVPRLVRDPLGGLGRRLAAQ